MISGLAQPKMRIAISAMGRVMFCGMFLVCGSARAQGEGGASAYGGLFADPSAPTNVIPGPTPLLPAQAPPQPAPYFQPNSAMPNGTQPDGKQPPRQPVNAQTVPPGSWGTAGTGPNVGSRLWGSGSSTAAGRTLPTGASNGYCDPQVAKLDEQLRSQVMDSRTQLARGMFSMLPTGMLNLSCVESIINSTVNIFGPGGLRGILDQLLAAFSCERVLRLVNTYANQEISQYTSQAMGYINDRVNSLGIGEVIPGVSLASLTSNRVNLQPTVNIGGAGSNYVNLAQMWNSTGSYIGNGGPGSGSVIMPSRLLGQ